MSAATSPDEDGFRAYVRVVDDKDEAFFFIRKDLMAKLENIERTEFTPEKSIELNLARVLRSYGSYVTIFITQ